MPNMKERLRFEVVYLALQTLDATALIEELGQDELLPAARNSRIRELANVVDQALQEEVERRRCSYIKRRVSQIEKERWRKNFKGTRR
tara:strand:- start:310 stop:573 length:264 start_codon:yes stop_codon:yes gene_type:complete